MLDFPLHDHVDVNPLITQLVKGIVQQKPPHL